MAEPIITIKYGNNFANIYTFEVNPFPVKIVKIMIIDRIQQANGTQISYYRGEKYQFEFSWKNIPQSMYDSLLLIRKEKEPYQLVLQNMTPSGIFMVNWTGNYDFSYWSPLVTGGYSGQIIFREV
jgi:hypothetical protein